MNALRHVLFALALLALASVSRNGAAAGPSNHADGSMTLAGTTVQLKSATALEVDNGSGERSTLILLSEAPIDIRAALASTDPYIAILNDPAIDAITHAMVFVSKDRVSINAHKAGDDMQYIASRKFGLKAEVSGGDGKPLIGELRSTGEKMAMQIDARFTVEIANSTP